MYIVSDMGRPTGGYRAGLQEAAHGKKTIHGFVYVSFTKYIKYFWQEKKNTLRIFCIILSFVRSPWLNFNWIPSSITG